MNLILNVEWRGVLALIWLVCGLLILLLLQRIIDDIFQSYFIPLWVIGGWLGPSFLLAISGFRNGNFASKCCSVLVFIALASPILLIFYVSHQLYGR